MVTFLASFLIWFLVLGIGIVWWVDGRKFKEMTLHAIVAALVAWGLGALLKDLFKVTRPYLLNGRRPLTATIPTDGAFPSTHAAAAFALAISIYLHNPKLGLVFLLMSILIGVGRVAANVHYPLDVIGGAALGIAVAMVVDRLHVFELVKKGNRRS